ncbi:hypothetical protein OHS18_36595 [Amycolatopsis sp. NBC_00355]|uniref:hypothetical protein n=1 Tax=Amycolatopsis sp. NBC_00355 TaxID=2975957 RepID=UPI002E258278
MTETGGAPGEEGADTPTPSRGFAQAPAPGSGEAKPPEGHDQSPPTPPTGWQAPDPRGAQPPPGWQQQAPTPYGGPPPQYPQFPQQRASGPHGLGKPGVIALRPLNIGDILDGAITAIRRNPLLILGVGAVLAVLSAGISFLVQKYLYADLEKLTSVAELGPGATDSQAQDALFSAFGDVFLLVLPSAALTTLLTTLLNGFLAAVMGRAALGREVTFSIAWAEVRPRLLPLLGVGLVYSVVATIGLMLCVVPGVVAYVFWALASPALILERGTFKQAFSRSVKLVSRAFWRVLGILALAWVIQYLFNTIIQLPFTLGTSVFQQVLNPSAAPVVPGTGDLLLQGVGQIVSGTIAMPFVALVTVIIYLDQRMRREGMDIELARAAGVTPPQAW